MAKKSTRKDDSYQRNERVTEFETRDGRKMAAIRCELCEGKGCQGCDHLGFVIQESLI